VRPLRRGHASGRGEVTECILPGDRTRPFLEIGDAIEWADQECEDCPGFASRCYGSPDKAPVSGRELVAFLRDAKRKFDAGETEFRDC
jgi:hypothetical protein